MGRLNWRRVGCCALIVLPLAASAQSPFSFGGDTSASQNNTVGGVATIDLITVKANSPGIPLRHGNVQKGSERVQLGAAVLKAGVDYQMDYEVGVVYIARAMKAGDAVTVAYRYDGTKPNVSGASNMNPLSGVKYNFAPGAQMMMGLGMTERTADGQVISSSVLGLNNNFNVGSAGFLKGLYYYGQRQKVDANSLYDAPTAEGNADAGSSQMIVQSLQSKLWGGSITADYQDISKNFKAFGMAGAAGYNASQLEKEKGLTRMGFGLKDIKMGGAKIGSSYRSVADGNAGIEWRSYDVAAGGITFNWNSQRVDSDFTRFNDIVEADRAQLLKEAGISRENFGAKFAMKTGGIQFLSNQIEDMKSGKSINRREFLLDTSKLNIKIGDQSVDNGFGRVGSLRGEEQPYGLEVGLKRQWLKMDANLLGKDFQPIRFSQSIIDSPGGGSATALDFSAGGKTWSLEHGARSYDGSFTGFAPLNGTKEGDDTIAAIANMYGKGTAANIGGERGKFTQSAGIDRSFDRLTFSPNKNLSFGFETLRLQGKQDGGQVDTATIKGKDFNAMFRQQRLGSQFTELNSLMDFEKQRLGLISGLQRTDFLLNFNFRKTAFTVSQMTADSPEGGATRQQFALNNGKLQISANAREVDPSFNSVGQLVDPENNLLNQLKGYKEHDVKVKWQILPGLNLDFTDFSAVSDSLGKDSKNQTTILNWKPSNNTQVFYSRMQNDGNDPFAVLFANLTEKISLVQKFGRLGTLQFFNETQAYDDKTSTLPDFHRQYLAYEAALDKNTKFRTEQTRTDYDNGDKENISANTVSTNLSKRVGVSLTDTRIDRNGGDRDENNRNYGFWYDLGNGVQIAYGYARQLNGDNGQLQQNLSVGSTAGQVAPEQAGAGAPASLGNLQFGGGYGERSWDGSTERTQAFSKMSIGTKKPFQAGFLRDVKFNFGVDTAADYNKWIRENKMLAVSGKIGSNAIGYSYQGQMYVNGFRAVDRTFTFATDQSDKRWLRANIFYKVRTLPEGDQVMIRNYNITAKVADNLNLSHQMITNPEVAKGDAILGSIPQAARSNAWKLDFKRPGQYTIGAEWKEMIDDNSKALSRTGGVNLTLFEKSGSPLKLFYGIEEVRGNVPHMLTSRYSLQFDQRAGPNQTFSLFAGNVSYMYDVTQGFKANNWTMRLDYQLRF